MSQEPEAMWDGHLGGIKTSGHKIELTSEDVLPVSSASYRAAPTARNFATDNIDRMLKEDIIEPATTEWASPIVFPPKKNGSLRFSADYRKLNPLAAKD